MAVVDCDDVMGEFWDLLDGATNAWRAAALHQHIAGCERCGPMIAFHRRFLRALRSHEHGCV